MKRLVGVLTVRNGWVVASYGFRKWLPVGRIHPQIEELERWQVDEIAILDISPDAASGGGQRILDALRAMNPLTPIVVGGGITSLHDAKRILDGGADRVLLGSGAFTDPSLVDVISSHYGDQAVVVAVPLATTGNLSWVDPKSGSSKGVRLVREVIPSDWGGEVLLMDVSADGGYDRFNMSLVDDMVQVLPEMSAMIFGGFRTPEAVDIALKHPNVSAICFGNAIHQRELFIRKMKADVHHSLRPFVE